MADNRDTAAKIPLDPMAMQQYSVQLSQTGAGWFGPLYPLHPIAPPEVAGRQFDLEPGYNIITRPRQQDRVSFEVLRSLADSYDMLRLIIETRKDQVDHVNLIFRAKKDRVVPQVRIDRIEAFFESPNKTHDFRTWLRMLLEDLFVIDAPTLWKQRSLDGTLIGLHPLDGATIKRVIDDWGRTPQPYYDETGQLIVMPAFQQVLKGFPAVDYMADDIIYAPRNMRTNKVYGFSPVEQIIVTVNIALRRQLFTLKYYTEGNIPEALIGVPDAWTPDQIKQFQDYWDLYFTGDLSARRHAKFVPGGVAKTFIQTKEPELKNVFDEWLAKICCYAFSVSPQWATSQVNRATATVAKEQAEEEGLVPILNWITRLLTKIIRDDLREPDIECVVSDDEQIDPETEFTIVSGLVDRAIITRNQALERLGMDQDDDTPEANMLGFTTASGFVPLSQEEKDRIAQASMDRQAEMALLNAPSPGPSGNGGPGGDDTSATSKGGTGQDTSDSSRPGGPGKSDDGKSDRADKIDGADVRDLHVHLSMPALLEKAAHDVSGESRDDRGRFTSSGGPTSRERQKAERAKNRSEEDRSRDRAGRFAGGKLTHKQLRHQTEKVTYYAISAGALHAMSKAVEAITPDTGLGNLVGQGVARTLNGLAISLVSESAKAIVYTGARSVGVDSEIAKKAASLITKNAKSAIKIHGEMRSSKKDSEDDEEEKMSVVEDLRKSEDDDDQDAIVLAQTLLPKYLPDVIDDFFDHQSIHAEEDERDDLEKYRDFVQKIAETTMSEIDKLGKSEGDQN